MQEFEYTVTDADGIHARPAGLLVRVVKPLSSQVFLSCGEKTADARKLLAVMSLGVRCGDTLTVRVSGENEKQDAQAVKSFLSEHL